MTRGFWAEHCRKCNAVYAESEIRECLHCGQDTCPSCGTPLEWPAYHEECRKIVDGETEGSQ